MHRDEHPGAARLDARRSSERAPKRGQDHERAEEKAETSRPAISPDRRCSGWASDADRYSGVNSGSKRRARRLELLATVRRQHRRVDDLEELGDEHPDAERQRGHRQRDHAPPRTIVS
jgi:hypothetical protein